MDGTEIFKSTPIIIIIINILMLASNIPYILYTIHK